MSEFCLDLSTLFVSVCLLFRYFIYSFCVCLYTFEATVFFLSTFNTFHYSYSKLPVVDMVLVQKLQVREQQAVMIV